MKKAFSLILAAMLVSSSVLPIFSQSRLAATGSKKRSVISESTSFASFGAYTDGDGVWLAWQMRAEIGNIGFYVYRVGKNGVELLSPSKFVGGSAIHGREIPSYGESYGYYDRSGSEDVAYYVEAFSLTGTKVATEQVYPHYVYSLESLTGLSQEQLDLRSEPEPTLLERNLPKFSKEIATEISENAIVPDPVTHRTVISTPGAIRIGVKNEGIFRVTEDQLDAAGFDIDADSALWQLYVDGVEQAMIVPKGGEYIEFYGKGLDRNETDIRRYYLIVGTTPGRRMEPRVATRSTSTVITPNYAQTYVKKERIQWVDDITNDDTDNYFGRGIGAGVSTMTFNLSGVDFASTASTMRLLFQGYSSTDHVMEVTLNDQVLPPTASLPNQGGEWAYSGTYSIPTSLLREGANTIKFRSAFGGGDFSFFDTMSIDFNRKYLAEQNRFAFSTQNYRAAKVEGFTSANVRVFDITRESSPALMTNLPIQTDGTTFAAVIPASRGRSFYAVEDTALLAPESVTPNNPELVGIPTNGADLVIIAYKDFLPEAQTWANYRMSQGVSVKVIEVTELFDEFDYGAFGSISIKRFLQYAHQNWVNPPEYALLIGDGSWDSRNYEGLGYFNHVPSRIVSTVYTDTASDEALADFNGDGLSEIAIGRIAVRTAAQVTTVYNKTVAWEAQTGNPLDRGALFAYDVNNGYTFDQMSVNLRNLIPTVPATMIRRGDTNAQANVIAAMNTGKYIVNYSGHGSAGSWNADFFNVTTIAHPVMVDHNPSIYTMLTCLNGFFHWLYNPSLAEVLTNTPNRGAVVSWASSGKTTPDIQEVMALRFYSKLGQGTIPRMGDLIKDAKGSLVNYGADVRLSWVLIGDPMLKVR